MLQWPHEHSGRRLERIAAGTTLKNISIRECVAPLPSDVIAGSNFAVVSYHVGRWMRYRTVKLAPNSTIKADDEVRLNLDDCEAPLVLVGAGDH